MRAFRMPGALDEDSAPVAALWDHGCRGVVQDGATLVAYFDEEVILPVEGTWESVDDVDWLETYFSSLQPVDVGPLVVVPTHASASLSAGQKPLWLDPGMAFGTGHHETTRAILRALGRIELADRSVLDVGAGSGILAIAADILGAARVLGIDDDPATVPVARANARLNRSRARFALATLPAPRPGGATNPSRASGRIPEPDSDAPSEAVPDVRGPWDVVVANLFAELHAQLMLAYEAVLAPGGTLLLAGIADERLDLVLDAVPSTLAVRTREADGAWWHVALERA